MMQGNIMREKAECHTIEDAKAGRLTRGAIIREVIDGSVVMSRFIGVSHRGYVWTHAGRNPQYVPDDTSQGFRTKCLEFDTREQAFRKRPKRLRYHSMRTLTERRGRRGELVQLNTAMGIYVGTTPRGAHWIAWEARNRADESYLRMCREFDRRYGQLKATQ